MKSIFPYKTKRDYPLILLLIPVLVILLLSTGNASDKGLEIIKQDEGYQFYEDGSPVMFYRTRALTTAAGTHARSNYCHPVIGLDGETVTEDFPKDHLHHRGIFWAWHQVYIKDQLIRDMWECNDFIWDVKDVTIESDDSEQISLNAVVLWKSTQWKDGSEPIASENLTIRLHKRRDNIRLIDYEIKISPLVEDLRIGGSDDDKGYGGFSTRIPLPDDLEMTDKNGAVTPDRVAVPAGEWLNFRGTFGKTISNIAVMVHPSHPGSTRYWILRKKGSCQNIAFPGRQPLPVQAEDPLFLKYRVVIHKDADLNKLFSAYASE